jgi:hypothetical protein
MFVLFILLATKKYFKLHHGIQQVNCVEKVGNLVIFVMKTQLT